MKQILANLALFDLTQYCKAHDIDCSGTHVYKYPRKYIYALVQDESGKALVTVSFTKNQAPVHSILV